MRCFCVLHYPPQSQDEWDTPDQKVVGDVETHGWSISLIASPDGLLPHWAFSIGLIHSFGVPNITMVGLDPRGMGHWINNVGERLRAGLRIKDGDTLDGVIDGYTLLVRQVAEGWSESMFGWCRWFAQQPEPPMYQLVWPDAQHRMPWDDEATEGCRIGQARLWLPPSEHPTGMWADWANKSPG